MIRFRCRDCKEKLEAPASMAGDPLQCPACGTFTNSPQLHSGFSPAAIWNRSPAAFRTGFLTTLGVISAVWISYWGYGTMQKIDLQPTTPTAQIISPAVTPTAKPAEPEPSSISLKTSVIDAFNDYLKERKFFPVLQKESVLRGRILQEYQYQIDATKESHYFSFYLDENNNLAAISAGWLELHLTDKDLIKQADDEGYLPIIHEHSQSTFEQMVVLLANCDEYHATAGSQVLGKWIAEVTRSHNDFGNGNYGYYVVGTAINW